MKLVRMQVEIARLLIVQVRGRAAAARRQGRNEVGASAIEWAIIAAVCVGLALAVYSVVKGVVDENSKEIQDGENP